MSRATVDGFDYRTNRAVSMTRAEWQAKYPYPAFRRTVENGETFYHSLTGTGRDEDRPARIVAEVYANIPEVRP